MTFVSLKSIVKNVLMQKGYPIHWYIQFLVYAKDCLMELTFDDLKVINTARIPVNSTTNALDLPNDFQDYIRVDAAVGQMVRPLVETDKLNRLVARDSNFNPTSYAVSNSTNNNQTFYGYLYPFYWHSVNWNEFGEQTGRYFGYGAGVQDDVFTIIRERNQIQLTEDMVVTDLIVEYISDGMNANSATKVDPYAKATITAYIHWQCKENNRTSSLQERAILKQEYIDQRKILRARMSDLTIEKIKRLFQRASYASPKSA